MRDRQRAVGGGNQPTSWIHPAATVRGSVDPRTCCSRRRRARGRRRLDRDLRRNVVGEPEASGRTRHPSRSCAAVRHRRAVRCRCRDAQFSATSGRACADGCRAESGGVSFRTAPSGKRTVNAHVAPTANPTLPRWRHQGRRSRAPGTRWPTTWRRRTAASLARRCGVSPSATNGTTSSEPRRGWTPSCTVRSRVDASVIASRRTAVSVAWGVPTMVKTLRL